MRKTSIRIPDKNMIGVVTLQVESRETNRESYLDWPSSIITAIVTQIRNWIQHNTCTLFLLLLQIFNLVLHQQTTVTLLETFSFTVLISETIKGTYTLLKLIHYVVWRLPRRDTTTVDQGETSFLSENSARQIRYCHPVHKWPSESMPTGLGNQCHSLLDDQSTHDKKTNQ